MQSKGDEMPWAVQTPWTERVSVLLPGISGRVIGVHLTVILSKRLQLLWHQTAFGAWVPFVTPQPLHCRRGGREKSDIETQLPC